MHIGTAAGLVSILVMTALAGCVEEGAPEPGPPALLPTHDLSGRIVTPAFNPIEGAKVWLGQSGHCTMDGICTDDWNILETTTDVVGAFRLAGIWQGNVSLHVEHADYQDTNMTVRVPGQAPNITLTPINRVVPFQAQVPFNGYIECGAEYLIISPACDTIITYAGGPALVQTDSTFGFEATDGWQTIVVDTFYQEADHPGIAGLRLSAYAADGSTDLGEYDRLAQVVGEGPFTLRLEPGADYGDDVPVPEGPGGFRMEYFPHGHGADTVCDPSGTCFLGVGVAFQIQFEAVATIFYHETAPEGWTILA